MKIIAHRGAAGEAPENTMAAFALALRQGADALEFDVRLSRDGVPVVIHDARLERTTDGRGRVSDFTAKELKRLDAGSRFNRKFPQKARSSFAGQRIPLLAELLEWMRHQNFPGFLEIKEGSPRQPGIEETVCDLIRRTRSEHLVTIISFDNAVLEHIRKLSWRGTLGVSVERPALALRRAARLGARYLVPHWALATPGFVEQAHSAGLRVAVWTVNSPRLMRRKILDGVDGIITDFPSKLCEVRESLRECARPSASQI